VSGDNEKALLGALLLEPVHLPEVMEVVRPADFLSPLGEDIFTAMLEMFSSAEHIDTLTVANKMSRHLGLVNNGGGVFLFDLTHHCPSPSAALSYANEVAKQATRRRLKGALTRGMQLVDGDMDPDELVEVAANEVLMSARPATSVGWVGATMDDFVSTLDQPVRYIPTPWPSLNALIGGWAQGRMYVVGARPSVGKSVLAVQAACGLADHGAVALNSLEMSEAEIQARMLAHYADIDLTSIQAHKVPAEAIPRMRAAVQQIKGLTLSIDDRPSPTALDIGANARSLSRRMHVAGAVIDYVQLIGDENSTRSRQEEVSAISRQMKLLAKALDIPVIALSQLNRQSQNRADRVPDMADLRESGSLEQDADVVILLSKKRMKDEGTGLEYDDPHTILVQVAKNRNGPTGAFTLELEGAYARLRNPALSASYGIGTVVPD
jgi:replicative DNA helicase